MNNEEQLQKVSEMITLLTLGGILGLSISSIYQHYYPNKKDECLVPRTEIYFYHDMAKHDGSIINYDKVIFTYEGQDETLIPTNSTHIYVEGNIVSCEQKNREQSIH